jgi:hypothetical protein
MLNFLEELKAQLEADLKAAHREWNEKRTEESRLAFEEAFGDWWQLRQVHARETVTRDAFSESFAGCTSSTVAP